MEQLNLYDYLGKEEDPVYQLLNLIEVDSTFSIRGFEVRQNEHGLYEISNENFHECKKTINDCYTFIQKKLSVQS